MRGQNKRKDHSETKNKDENGRPERNEYLDERGGGGGDRMKNKDEKNDGGSMRESVDDIDDDRTHIRTGRGGNASYTGSRNTIYSSSFGEQTPPFGNVIADDLSEPSAGGEKYRESRLANFFLYPTRFRRSRVGSYVSSEEGKSSATSSGGSQILYGRNSCLSRSSARWSRYNPSDGSCVPIDTAEVVAKTDRDEEVNIEQDTADNAGGEVDNSNGDTDNSRNGGPSSATTTEPSTRGSGNVTKSSIMWRFIFWYRGYDDDYDHNDDNNSDRCAGAWVWLFLFLLFVLAFLSSVYIVLKEADKKRMNEQNQRPRPSPPRSSVMSPSTSPSNTPTSSPSTSSLPSSSPTILYPTSSPSSAREMAVISKLLVESVTDRVTLKDPNTVQNLALIWIINDDPRRVETSDPSLIQRFTLVAMFFATSGERWTNALNWLKAPSECNWRGVKCALSSTLSLLPSSSSSFAGAVNSGIKTMTGTGRSGNHDRNSNNTAFKELNVSHIPPATTMEAVAQEEEYRAVISMDLTDNGLVGPLPDEMGAGSSLRFLRHLRFGTNVITGTIPSSFGRLLHLRDLVLSRNKLTGTIPPSLFNMTSLLSSHLHLSSRPRSFSSLEEVDLAYNFLSGSIPAELFGTSPSTLKIVSLNNNLLNGTFPTSTGGSSLELLSLNDNRLMGTIPSTIGMLTNLRVLNLHNNDLTGTIPAESFRSLTNLVELHLEGNDRLTGTVPQAICDLNLVNFGKDYYKEDTMALILLPNVICTCCGGSVAGRDGEGGDITSVLSGGDGSRMENHSRMRRRRRQSGG